MQSLPEVRADEVRDGVRSGWIIPEAYGLGC
jgi:hypothetical protein